MTGTTGTASGQTDPTGTAAPAAPPAGHGSAGEAVRAVLFIGIMYSLLPVVGLVGLPSAILSRRGALGSVHRYCRWVLWLLRALCGTRTEIRGKLPSGPCIVAAKHQSFLDVLMLSRDLPAPRFIMKRSLLWAPVVGYFARRIGCVAIDRQAGGEAVRSMISGLREDGPASGQIIIFPQGTRVAPGRHVTYRGGVAKLYAAFDLPVVPAAANTGWFWPRRGMRRTPGTAVVEFLEPIRPGLTSAELMAAVEKSIEEGSDRLAAEAAAEIGQRAGR